MDDDEVNFPSPRPVYVQSPFCLYESQKAEIKSQKHKCFCVLYVLG
jgi:hypothetical protein